METAASSDDANPIKLNDLMLIDLTQHTTRCSNRSDKSQEHLISRHAAVETEAELIQIWLQFGASAMVGS